MSLRRKQLDEIYRLYSSGSRTQAELARDGVTQSAIFDVVSGKTWGHLDAV